MTIKLNNIYKSYDDNKYVIKDFNLEIKDGQFVVLVGPSGCGKSTLIRMIAGLEDISRGEIYIDDKLVNDISPQDRELAMVFQSYALYPHMTVRENIAYPLKLRKINKKEIEISVVEVAKTLGIEELLDRKPSQLSGGQKQRVAIGRCIIRSPKAFLMDEPLSNLDAKLRVQMREELSELHRKIDKTFIYVTHDQIEALTLGDLIVVMNDGIIQQAGSPTELFNNPVNKFVAEFIGSPAMNFLEYDNGEVGINQTKLRFDINRPIWIGIRPEKISLIDNGGIKFDAEIVSIERLGSENYIYMNVNGKTILARDFNLIDVEKGQTHSFYIKEEDIKIFDRDSENYIGANIIKA